LIRLRSYLYHFKVKKLSVSIYPIFQQASADFEKQLAVLDVNVLTISGYPQTYLKYLIQHRKHYLRLYATVLSSVVKHSSLLPKDAVLIDYGTGNGLLAMLAAAAGFKKVIAVDVDEVFLNAAKQTAHALGYNTIEFVKAGEETFHLLPLRNAPALIVGTDVVEHIYKLELFFKQLGTATAIKAACFTTASNPHNPVRVRNYKQLHIKEELVGGDSTDRVLFGDVHASFLSMREKIIAHHFPQADNSKVTTIAKAGRGLRKDDLIIMAEEYFKTGKLRVVDETDTNTCEPETGSWAERMLPVETYKQLYRSNGFEFYLGNGFYDAEKGVFIRKTAIKLLNFLMQTFPVIGIKAAPFIFLEGKRK
jgi:2-polyprenyl-3-methyl-5-hydroxy-6-metoxy-1,4-benzoquinol methylase